MGKTERLRMPPFRGDRDPEHEAQAPGKFEVVRHNWHWGFQEDHALYPYTFEEAARDCPTWFREERNRYFLVTVVPEGEIRYRGEGREFLVRGAKVLVIPQGTAFYFETTRKAHYQKLSLFVLGVNLAAITETMALDHMELIAVPDLDAFVAELRAIDALLVAGKAENMPEMAGRTFALLNRLSQFKRGQDGGGFLFRLAKERLGGDLARPLLIADLAAELRVSPCTLDRLFQAKLGVTPRAYRIERKVEQAKKLLLETELSCKEIAGKLGYCNPFHFSNEFRRLTGFPPGQFRRG